MKKILLSATAVLIYLVSSAQCLLKEIQLEKRIANSVLIIEGKVISKHSFWNVDHTMIYTSNRVRIFKIFKGTASSGMIDILTVGGVVGDRMIKTNSLLSLEMDETGIFLCETPKHFRALPAAAPGSALYETYGSRQGFIKYDLQNQTAADPFKKYHDVKNDLYSVFSSSQRYAEILPLHNHNVQASVESPTAITGFSPGTITGGTGSVLTITGSNFGATQGSGFVEFKNADDGGATFIQPLASQYISWSTVQIQVQVPSGAGTGVIRVTQGITFTSATALTVSYAHLNVDFDPGSGIVAYQTDHIDDNGGGGYTWRMNTNFDANTVARASFMRAFDTWRCGTNINWEIGATTSINDGVSDGTNIICFDDAAPLSAGVRGVCYSYWSGCASGPAIIWYVNELDMIFDEGSNIAPSTWQFGPAAPLGSEYDFESVAVHELGHGHQLGHVIEPGAIMHYDLASGVQNRSLGGNDLAGGNFVQAKSETPNICGPGAMLAYSSCALPLTITSVKAYQKNNIIQVQWTNATETNTDHYEIEESNDGIHFTAAATISVKAGNGTSADYSWPDEKVNDGINYYRIKTVGFNGTMEYSGIVWVKLVNGTPVIGVHPNLVIGGNFTIQINNLEKGVYTLNLYNAAGQQVLSRRIVQHSSSVTEDIHLPSIAAGVYYIRIGGNHLNLRKTILVNN